MTSRTAASRNSGEYFLELLGTISPIGSPQFYLRPLSGENRAAHASYEHTSFTFLGYGFRSRMVRTKKGSYLFSVNPAISDDAAKRVRAQIRAWRLHLRSGSTLADLAREINTVVRGWINYYGRYYRSALCSSLNRINDYLVRWIMRKYKRYRRRRMRAREALRRASMLYPGLFAHWQIAKP